MLYCRLYLLCMYKFLNKCLCAKFFLINFNNINHKKSRPKKEGSMRVIGIMYLLLCNLMHVETENHAVTSVLSAFDFNSNFRYVRWNVDCFVAECALVRFR